MKPPELRFRRRKETPGKSIVIGKSECMSSSMMDAPYSAPFLLSSLVLILSRHTASFTYLSRTFQEGSFFVPLPGGIQVTAQLPSTRWEHIGWIEKGKEEYGAAL